MIGDESQGQLPPNHSLSYSHRSMLHDMSNRSELLKASLIVKEPKTLTGSGQKACSRLLHQGMGAHGHEGCWCIGRDYVIRVIQTEQGKPDVPPSRGQAMPQGTLLGSGKRRLEKANAAL